MLMLLKMTNDDSDGDIAINLSQFASMMKTNISINLITSTGEIISVFEYPEDELEKISEEQAKHVVDELFLYILMFKGSYIDIPQQFFRTKHRVLPSENDTDTVEGRKSMIDRLLSPNRDF